MDQLQWKHVGPIAKSTFYSTLPSAALAVKLAAGAFVAFGAAFGQTYIIYPAYAPSGSRTDVPTPDKHGMPIFEDLTLESPDKLKIKAYLMLHGASPAGTDVEEAKKRPTILFLHANAGNMGHRLPFAHIFYERLKCNVFMLSYRGYGLSEGQPNEQGIRMDAQLALDYIRSHPVLEKTKVVLYGQSIGGAVAVDLAANNPDRVDGIILENTFLSMSKVAMAAMPIASPYILMGLLKEKWNSGKAVQKLPATLPMLFLAGQQDEIVPPSQFLKLFKLCSSQKKKMRQYVHGTHNDTCVQPGYWTEVQAWLHDEIAHLPKDDKPKRGETFDERRMQGAEAELQGTMGAGSLAP